MTLIILTSLIAGVISGYILLTPDLALFFDELSGWALVFLLFCIGVDIGRQRKILSEFKILGFKVLLIPFAIIAGSILATAVVGLLIGMPLKEATAAGAGFGWYSLSGVLVTQIYSAEAGTLAFLTNVMREIIAVITIPLLARYVGKYEAIAPGGATTMDVTLPLISKSAGSDVTLTAFINGVILTALVPVLVTVLLRLPV
jgi:uncharacterized membrane protein YbjE (DUF340 family)